MNISALSRPINPADLPLEQLAANPNLSEREKIGELSRQFEAVLLRQILQNAQKTVIKSDLSDDSMAGSIYQDMIVNQMADGISRSGSFGLARSLEADFTRQLAAKPDAKSEEASEH